MNAIDDVYPSARRDYMTFSEFVAECLDSFNMGAITEYEMALKLSVALDGHLDNVLISGKGTND